MMALIDVCASMPIEEILRLPDVAERVDLYRAHSERFADQLRRCGREYGDLVAVDLRDEDVIFAGNRFLVYALFPQASVSAHVLWGKGRQNTVLAVGKSILDRSSALDVGALMLGFGGGGHRNAGTCQVPHDRADDVLAEIAAAVARAGRTVSAA